VRKQRSSTTTVLALLVLPVVPVECRLWSVDCGVWTVECGVCGVWRLWTVECRLWSVDCGVWSLWSVDCGVWSHTTVTHVTVDRGVVTEKKHIPVGPAHMFT
jgi:hypothetical protein